MRKRGPAGAHYGPLLGFKLRPVSLHLRVCELDAQPLKNGGFHCQALKLCRPAEGEGAAALRGGGEAQRGGDGLRAVRCRSIQLHLPRNGAVGDFSTTAEVIDHGAVARDLVADAQAWRWPVILAAQYGHGLEPVCFALAQYIGGLFYPVAAGKPKSNGVVPSLPPGSPENPDRCCLVKSWPVVAQAFTLMCKLLFIERGQRHGLGHFGDGDSCEFFPRWCGGPNLHQLGFVQLPQPLAGQSMAVALRVDLVGFVARKAPLASFQRA